MFLVTVYKKQEGLKEYCTWILLISPRTYTPDHSVGRFLCFHLIIFISFFHVNMAEARWKSRLPSIALPPPRRVGYFAVELYSFITSSFKSWDNSTIICVEEFLFLGGGVKIKFVAIKLDPLIVITRNHLTWTLKPEIKVGEHIFMGTCLIVQIMRFHYFLFFTLIYFLYQPELAHILF